LHAIAVRQNGSPPPPARKELGLLFVVALTSRLQEPENVLFRRDFRGINISVCLASPTAREDTKQILVRLAEQACEVLSLYERFEQQARDPGPGSVLRGR
jgi:hypothetical protein